MWITPPSKQSYPWRKVSRCEEHKCFLPASSSKQGWLNHGLAGKPSSGSRMFQEQRLDVKGSTAPLCFHLSEVGMTSSTLQTQQSWEQLHHYSLCVRVSWWSFGSTHCACKSWSLPSSAPFLSFHPLSSYLLHLFGYFLRWPYPTFLFFLPLLYSENTHTHNPTRSYDRKGCIGGIWRVKYQQRSYG